MWLMSHRLNLVTCIASINVAFNVPIYSKQVIFLLGKNNQNPKDPPIDHHDLIKQLFNGANQMEYTKIFK